MQLVIGVLLLLFGLRWLRKAILRAGGIMPLHDETKAFAQQEASLHDAQRRDEAHLDWIAGLTAFKAVVLEGLEVVFIVIAVGSGRGLIVPAAIGALAACALVLLIGIVVHRPVRERPGEHAQIWCWRSCCRHSAYSGPGRGWACPGRVRICPYWPLAVLFLTVGLLSVRAIKSPAREATS